MQCALDVMKFLKVEATRQHVAHPNVKKTVNKYLWEMKKCDIDRSHFYDYQTIHGSHKAHQVCSISH